MNYLERIEQQVCSWPNASSHPHRFLAREFRFANAEIGHIHAGGVVDIPFPRSVHDLLLADGLVEKHRWVPNSGWITFRIRSAEDVQRALWLMRLSYLRYALKKADDPHRVLEDFSEELQLSDRLKSLFEALVPKSAAA
jgi:hypothetical protein